jgi:hypothetical protein
MRNVVVMNQIISFHKLKPNTLVTIQEVVVLFSSAVPAAGSDQPAPHVGAGGAVVADEAVDGGVVRGELLLCHHVAH